MPEQHEAGHAGGLPPVHGHIVAKPAFEQHCLPLKEHRNAGGGAKQRSGQGGALAPVPAAHLRGKALPSVGHLVVAFGVDNAAKRIVVVGSGEGLGHQPRRTIGVVVGFEDVADRVDESRRPLGVEPGPAVEGGPDEPSVALEVFGDEQGVRKVVAQAVAEPAHKVPAVFQDVAGVVVFGADVERHVEAEAVYAVAFEPHPGVVAQVLPHFRTSVVGAGIAPRGGGAVVVVEVDAALAVLAPPVELPEVEVGGAKVVVDHVQNNGNAAPVSLADEAFEGIGAAVGGRDGERMGRVVAPRAVAGKRRYRHQLHRVHAEGFEVVEPGDGRVERGRPPPFAVAKRAHMEFVDHHLLAGRAHEGVVLPVKRLVVVDEAVACRVRDGAGVRVVAQQPRLAVADLVLVGRSCSDFGDEHRPVAAGLVGERKAEIPAAEASGHTHFVGVRGPDAKGRAAFPGAFVHERCAHTRRGRGGHNGVECGRMRRGDEVGHAEGNQARA